MEHSKGKIEIEAKEFSERLIKNSSGATEKRFVIKTRVLVFNKILETEFPLCDRFEMKHSVLPGRKFLKDQFIVDVFRFDLSYKYKSENLNEKTCYYINIAILSRNPGLYSTIRIKFNHKNKGSGSAKRA